MKKLAFIITIALFFGISSAQSQRGFKPLTVKDASMQNILLYNESHALVIGASDYTAGWPKLPGVPKDVQAVKSVLEDQGFNVVTVVDPNRDQLYLSFNEFINKYGGGAENRILIYFAGHGHTQKLKWGGDMGYIVPIDAPNPNRDNEGFLEKAMDMQQIEVYAKRIQSKHALFLFDACFSGSIFDLSRAVPQHITSKTARPVRQFITSGSAEEEVPDRSVFRSQFVEALNGEGDVDGDGYVTGAELGEFLQKTVINYSKGCQHPQYGKIKDPDLDKGDFVFEIAAAAPPPAPKSISTPKDSDFSLDDLNKAASRDEQSKAQWNEYLQKMTDAYNEVVEYEKLDVDPTLKITAWERFQRSFSDDNPFSDDDDTMRTYASTQVEIWKSEDRKHSLNGPAMGMKFVRIPGGTFVMGSNDGDNDEEPVYQVTIRSFQMMTTEVTQVMWKAVMSNNPSNFKGDNLPVEKVSWNDCQDFIRKLNQRDTGKNYRLPTEAEWEYACRAGTTTRFYSGNHYSYLNRVGWYNGNSGKKTHPVGEKQPNAWGLYDMHGNVWEWCQDWSGSYPSGSAWGLSTGSERVCRGGSWNHAVDDNRSANRGYYDPSYLANTLGFRLARSND